MKSLGAEGMRLEKDVTWVHLDDITKAGFEKSIYLFNP
jgi:hypothetical protein